jgi:energy-coupling factor transporter ATP-binding protein EcfA2
VVEGEFVGILGHNGMGKTALLNTSWRALVATSYRHVAIVVLIVLVALAGGAVVLLKPAYAGHPLSRLYRKLRRCFGRFRPNLS